MWQKYLRDIRFWFFHAVSGELTPIKQRKQNPFSSCYAKVLAITVIYYIFTFSDDMFFFWFSDIQSFYHGVLKAHRLSNNIALNDSIFFILFLTNQIEVLFSELPFSSLFNQVFERSHSLSRNQAHTNMFSVYENSFWNRTELQQLGNGPWTLHLISKVTLTFLCTFSFLILREMLFLLKACFLEWNFFNRLVTFFS